MIWVGAKMLYDLIQVRKGVQEVVMTGNLAKVRDRMTTLRVSHRRGSGLKGKQRVQYLIRPSESAEKFRKAPHGICLTGRGKHPTSPPCPDRQGGEFTHERRWRT